MIPTLPLPTRLPPYHNGHDDNTLSQTIFEEIGALQRSQRHQVGGNVADHASLGLSAPSADARSERRLLILREALEAPGPFITRDRVVRKKGVWRAITVFVPRKLGRPISGQTFPIASPRTLPPPFDVPRSDLSRILVPGTVD